MRLCTLCGSDLHTFFGRRKSPTPSILGHEMLGVVEELPPGQILCDLNDQPLQVGDRIVWGVAISCGNCFFCQRGLSQKCTLLRKFGHERHENNGLAMGGLATQMILVRGTPIVCVPDTIPDAVVAPASCASATVAAVLSKVPIREDRVVLILGAGMLGLTAAAYAKFQGKTTVLMVDRDAERLVRAREFGADATFRLPDELASLDTKIAELTHGRGVDAVLELTGSPELTQWGMERLRIGGDLVLAGAVYPTEAIHIHPEMLIRRCLTIHGVHNYSPEDLRSAVRFLESAWSQYPFESLVSAEYPFDAVEEAFQFAEMQKPFRVGVRFD